MPLGSPFLTGPRGLIRPSLGGSKIFTLTGALLSASGSAIVGAIVDLWREDGSHTWVAQTTSDSDGNYQFNPPTNGLYRATFRLDGSPNYFGITDYLVPS